MDVYGVMETLTNWTVANSGHDGQRRYIGLSSIGECDRAIYDAARFGRKWSVDDHLRSRLSFELEAALIERLRGSGLYGEREEIYLYDGLVQGHTDGRIRDAVLEIKTVSFDGHFPQQSRLPERVYWQVQAYMHYLERREAMVVYMARANGEMRFYPLRYNPRLGQAIEEKVERLVRAVRTTERPVCTCGMCE